MCPRPRTVCPTGDISVLRLRTAQRPPADIPSGRAVAPEGCAERAAAAKFPSAAIPTMKITDLPC
jgi:hypothetical protein